MLESDRTPVYECLRTLPPLANNGKSLKLKNTIEDAAAFQNSFVIVQDADKDWTKFYGLSRCMSPPVDRLS